MTNYRLLNKYITEEIDPNAVYILSLSYGKDSLACLGAIEKLGLSQKEMLIEDYLASFNERFSSLEQQLSCCKKTAKEKQIDTFYKECKL